ncbi:hypothetical protein [Pseudoalteromonas luteoviolacea]|nr:hypothetical protein [Pseudoalteromonas luteoviolacea]KZN31642.1 hypothetical protein N483_27085 [Pseudoalteromonas luteoviolacea NCIMB 1944]
MTVENNAAVLTLFRHPELVSGSIVQNVTDSERSEYVYLAQGEVSHFNSC